jgi:hypothetical protein
VIGPANLLEEVWRYKGKAGQLAHGLAARTTLIEAACERETWTTRTDTSFEAERCPLIA